MIREVTVARAVFEQASEQFGPERAPHGSPSEFDFVSGPLAAATFAFRDFDSLTFDLVPAVRSYTIVDPAFGPVVFVGLLAQDGTVEIVEFSHDPDYWRTVDDDPP